MPFPSPPLPLLVLAQALNAAGHGGCRRSFRYFSTHRNDTDKLHQPSPCQALYIRASAQVHTPAEHTMIPAPLLATTLTNRRRLRLPRSRPIAISHTSSRPLSPTKTDPPATPYHFEAASRHRPTSDRGSEFEVPRGCNVPIPATLERTLRVCRRTAAAFLRLARGS